MSLPHDRHVSDKPAQDAGLVALDFESLGESEVETARQRLMGLAASRRGEHLRLDLGRLGYLSSTGLGLLVAVNREVRATGGSLSLHNVNGTVYEIFALTRLTSLLDVRRRDQGRDQSA